MKGMKKIAWLGMTISLMAALASCGKTVEPATSSTVQPAVSSVSSVEESIPTASTETDSFVSGNETDSSAPALADESAAESGIADNQAEASPDYSDPANWAFCGVGENRAADLFIICPTVDMSEEYNMSLEDEKMRSRFVGSLNTEKGIFEESTKMYAPYYRQASMYVYSLDPKEREVALGIAYSDVSAAFAYYLENMNEGRPIILAGFSQGADMCYRLLKEYFGNEAVYDRLVVAYAIGWACTEEMVSEYPQIRPAKGEDDFGVVVSFDCEAPFVKETLINPAGQKAYTINPLNWKTDGTVADKSENLGACFLAYSGEIQSEQARLCGCYIDEERGVLKVTDIKSTDYPAAVSGLPEGSFHIYDLQFFYRNLQKNVADRLNAYISEDAREPAA